MSPKRSLGIVLAAALLTWGVAALLMNITEHKREGDRIAACPCPSESCPHPSRSVK